jgi:CHAP domain
MEMNRRNLIRLLPLLPLVPIFKPAAAQINEVDEATANYLRQWNSAGPGVPSSSASSSSSSTSVGTAPARPWDAQRAFEILSAAPRAPHATPYDTAVWFKELQDRSKAGEPFNAEWAEWANPVITSFFTVTNTVPQEGDQTSWCAAFVNWCLAAGRKNISFSAAAQSFNWDKRRFPTAGSPEVGDLVVFSGLENGSRQAFGHVGFLSRPLGAPEPEAKGKKGAWIIGGNQTVSDTPNDEKGAVTEKFYAEDHPTLKILDIVKTTNFNG